MGGGYKPIRSRRTRRQVPRASFASGTTGRCRGGNGVGGASCAPALGFAKGSRMACEETPWFSSAGREHRRRDLREVWSLPCPPGAPPYTDPCGDAVTPNQLWCADFKGDFKTGDGKRCYPLTLTDACSRM